MDKNAPYYIGLDCGTNSVGWAVTDSEYHLLKGIHRIKTDKRTKTKKQTLWGFRLFDEADTAAERRVNRSTRRRLARAKSRLKLLRILFEDEVAQVDPEFYQRLKESFYYEEDKNLRQKSKNTLFNDADFTDKDFHKDYPTIWHLRQAIIKADENEHFDIRLYFLAIQHILKHRGHFLLNGSIGDGGVEFAGIFDAFRTEAERAGYNIADISEEIEEILTKKMNKTDKKKILKDILYIEGDELDSDDGLKGQTELAGLLVGSKVDLKKIFGIEDDEKFSYSFADGVFEDKLPDIELAIGADNLDLIFAAKSIYDYAILRKLLGKHKMISDAMVANYDLHEVDLHKLKQVFKPFPETYRKLFKTELFDEKFPSYDAYIGKAYTEDKSYRRSSKNVSQEDFNKHLHKLLEEISGEVSPELAPVVEELLDRSDTSEKSVSPLLLPKQRGQAKGTIPMQLHGKELEKILAKLQQDYPSFAEVAPDEDEDYNTKAKKIAKIHTFRIPYYCGPVVKRKFDEDGNPVPGGKSQFSWADEEIAELVYPWNFDKLINKDQRAKNFVRRMTNKCTYLPTEDVLPKCSLTYQKYMVLNELNNLKINGQRIDNGLKQKIFELGYKDGRLRGNITLKKLKNWCRENGLVGANDELIGTSEVKTLPKYQTYQDFRRILGEGFERKYPREKLEEVVEAITVLGDEKKMLQKNIRGILGCDEDVAKQLGKLSYKDWGRMSEEFLNGIRVNNRTILDWLWEDNKNLMELLGQEVGFNKAVDEYNIVRCPESTSVSYRDVEALYCSPAVKRSVWQTMKIVNELAKNLGYKPEKIFLEVTRGEDEKARGKYTLARKKDLETKLKVVKNDDARAVLRELEGYDDKELQGKKLFLYFSQMGKCAYSGEPINIEELNNSQLYDIDHIYPRSKTKDDSITRNLVLVKAEYNRKKTNRFLYEFPEWQQKMRPVWMMWYRMGLITKEKYERLTRSTPLTNDELGGFIARQLVETSQSVKAIRDLLKRMYPNTKIVLVKAGQVSDFRHLMSHDKKDRDGNVYEQGRYEFIKVRDINDLHHAKDAYLNIVVGNVMNETFTDNPYEWIKRRDGKEYSINPERIFRSSRVYHRADGMETSYPEVKAWNYADSIKIVSDTMKRNDVIWTRMNYIESKEISDLQLVGKGESSEGLLRIKQQKRLDPKKYGGYNSLKGAHFALIECEDKKGNLQRRIVQIPIIAKDDVDGYVRENYTNARVVLPVIKVKSLLKIDNLPLVVVSKDSNTNNGYQHAMQAAFQPDTYNYLKNIYNIVTKDKMAKTKYEISDKDNVDANSNLALFDTFCEKLKLYLGYPEMGSVVEKVCLARGEFAELDLKQQCLVLGQIFFMFACKAQNAKLGVIGCGDSAGRIRIGNDKLFSYKNLLLINQSPTGLYEERIDLKTVQPKVIKQGKN